MNDKLKSCPFCGRDELYTYFRVDSELATEAIMIECECGCSLLVNVEDFKDVEHKKIYAFAKWNRRACE